MKSFLVSCIVLLMCLCAAEVFCTETCDYVTDLKPISIEVEPMLDQNIFTNSRVLENMLNDEREVQKQDYCANFQSNIAPHMRKIVTDWMLEVCEDQQCQPEVFFLSVNYLDRFLSTVNIKKNQFQLCASVCTQTTLSLLKNSGSGKLRSSMFFSGNFLQSPPQFS